MFNVPALDSLSYESSSAQSKVGDQAKSTLAGQDSLVGIDDVQKSFLITTQLVIGISSINTGSINIGSLSFLIVSFLLLFSLAIKHVLVLINY